jgi:hypothetical protein
MKSLFLAGAIALALAGCATGRQDLTVSGGPIAIGHSPAQVETAIEAGLKGRGWIVTGKAPGRITATVEGRGKTSATVAVVYSGTAYSVEYLDSVGLSYNARSGEIHKTYKRWVANLKSAIDARMNQRRPGN